MNAPDSLRRQVTPDEYRRVDGVLSEAYDRMDELSPSQRDFVEVHIGRIAKLEDGLWMSERELGVVVQIKRRLRK